MSNAGDFSSGVEFLRILSRFKKGKENLGSSVHVLHKTSHLEVARRSRAVVWSAICFKIMTRYTCGFFPRILAIIPATRYTCVFCHVYLRFIPKYKTIFLQTRIYMRTKNSIYMRYKQACGICGRRMSSYKRHQIIPSAKKPLHVRWS